MMHYFEWACVVVFLGLVVLLLYRSFRGGEGSLRVAVAALTILAGGLAGSMWWGSHQEDRMNILEARLQAAPAEGRDGGYISSDHCRACHPREFHSWHRSYHRTMTQYATPTTVLGDFDEVTLKAQGETYHLEREGDEFWVEMPDPDWRLKQTMEGLPNDSDSAPLSRRRVTLLTGSHHMQTFWVGAEEGRMQYGIPFSWLPEEQRWVPRNATFLMDPEYPPVFQMWNMNCIQCHSTAGQPRPGEEKEEVLDTRVAEIGIACEACHGPAEEHLAANRSPLQRYRRHQDSEGGDPTIVNPARLDARRSSQVCGQCHSIKIPKQQEFGWPYNGFSYRPGDDLHSGMHVLRPRVQQDEDWFQEMLRWDPGMIEGLFWPDGIARVSGRDYSSMIESACYQQGELSCLSCHSMHNYQHRADQLAVSKDSDAACLQCHQTFAGRISEHTRHAEMSEGSRCYNCHMPHTTYGLMKAIRSHYIDSPSVEVELETGRPNACNLCHLDKSLQWTSLELSKGWGVPETEVPEERRNISDALWLGLRGDAGQRALVAWHFGWDEARQASGDQWQTPLLAALLKDPYPVIRYIAHRSLRSLPEFSSFEYDFLGSSHHRQQAAERALERWRQRHHSHVDPSLLIQGPGQLDERRFLELLNLRDDRSMYLKE